MKMRFRTDGWHFADKKAAGESFEDQCAPSDPWLALDSEARKTWNETPKAEPGDVWRIHWKHDDGNGNQIDDWIAGYAICCIGCGRVHNWTGARNCPQKITKEWGESCIHRENHSSCWDWSGSAEEGTLTASPSLQVIADNPGECAWHGYIIQGNVRV